MGSLYKQYKRRMVLTIMSLLFSILLVITSVTYFMMKNAMERQLGLGVRGVAVAVSLMISRDMDGYRNFLATRDIHSEYYQTMQNNFTRIKEQNNIRFIYTINRLDDTHTEFILDAEPVGSENYSAPGDPETENTVTLQAFNTKQPVILPPTVSDFGTLIGSAAPIIDEKGAVAGVVGVDIDISTVSLTLRNWLVVLIVAYFFLFCLIGFLLSKISVSLLEPMLKDKLTGAYNKRYSDTLLQWCINSAMKQKHNFSIMMLDLDHFKRVNDTYGHNAGDTVLSAVSSIIQSCLRKEDFLVRYGGDEFLVLLFNLDSDIALSVAERTRKKIEAAVIGINDDDGNETKISITISIGVASLRLKQTTTGMDLINNVDKALYKAKEIRNKSVLFTE